MEYKWAGVAESDKRYGLRGEVAAVLGGPVVVCQHQEDQGHTLGHYSGEAVVE